MNKLIPLYQIFADHIEKIIGVMSSQKKVKCAKYYDGKRNI